MKFLCLVLLSFFNSYNSFAQAGHTGCPRGDLSTIQCNVQGKTFCFQHQINLSAGIGGKHFAEARMENSRNEVLASDTQDTGYMLLNSDPRSRSGTDGADISEILAKGQDLIWGGFGFYDGTCDQEVSHFSNDPELKEHSSIFPKKVKRCISGKTIKKMYSLNETKLALTETTESSDFNYINKMGYQEVNPISSRLTVSCVNLNN